MLTAVCDTLSKLLAAVKTCLRQGPPRPPGYKIALNDPRRCTIEGFYKRRHGCGRQCWADASNCLFALVRKLPKPYSHRQARRAADGPAASAGAGDAKVQVMEVWLSKVFSLTEAVPHREGAELLTGAAPPPPPPPPPAVTSALGSATAKGDVGGGGISCASRLRVSVLLLAPTVLRGRTEQRNNQDSLVERVDCPKTPQICKA